MLSNLNPDEWTISAAVVGQILSENMDENELNSLGNWLMLLGQYMETYAVQKVIYKNKNKN